MHLILSSAVINRKMKMIEAPPYEVIAKKFFGKFITALKFFTTFDVSSL